MTTCLRRPANRRQQIEHVGKDLIKHYGTRKQYTVAEVQAANRRQGIDLDVACWSHAFFNSHRDFDALHRTQGEACDYAAMKGEIVAELATPGSVVDATELEGSWLDLSDLDLSFLNLFD